MTLNEARIKAKKYSTDCGVYIIARIVYSLKTDSYEVSPDCYTLSDWHDGASVELWENGKNKGKP